MYHPPQEILRPFLLVCESKNPRLIGIVLGSIQKLLAHNAVSDEGRVQIIQALQQVRQARNDITHGYQQGRPLSFVQFGRGKGAVSCRCPHVWLQALSSAPDAANLLEGRIMLGS